MASTTVGAAVKASTRSSEDGVASGGEPLKTIQPTALATATGTWLPSSAPQYGWKQSTAGNMAALIQVKYAMRPVQPARRSCLRLLGLLRRVPPSLEPGTPY